MYVKTLKRLKTSKNDISEVFPVYVFDMLN